MIKQLDGSLKKLEDIVTTLEQGELSLEASLKLFEEGIKLTRTCQKGLSEAEQKIEQLTATTSDQNDDA